MTYSKIRASKRTILKNVLFKKNMRIEQIVFTTLKTVTNKYNFVAPVPIIDAMNCEAREEEAAKRESTAIQEAQLLFKRKYIKEV